MTRYRLEQQDSENQWRWCAIAEADDLYQLLELVPLQRAWRYRAIDMECRAARRGDELVGAGASQWKNQKNQIIKLRQERDQS